MKADIGAALRFFPTESKIREKKLPAASEAAILQLRDLAELMEGFGDSGDVLSVFRYLQTRQERYDFAMLRWLTLPMNIGQLYFKDTLKAAIENALAHVLRVRGIVDTGTLFAELITSDQSNTFAQLVARYLDKFQYTRTRGDKRLTEYTQINEDISRLAFRLRIEGRPAGLLPDRSVQTASIAGRFNPV